MQHQIVQYRNSAALKNATSYSTVSHREILIQVNIKIVHHQIVQCQNRATSQHEKSAKSNSGTIMK